MADEQRCAYETDADYYCYWRDVVVPRLEEEKAQLQQRHDTMFDATTRAGQELNDMTTRLAQAEAAAAALREALQNSTLMLKSLYGFEANCEGALDEQVRENKKALSLDAGRAQSRTDVPHSIGYVGYSDEVEKLREVARAAEDVLKLKELRGADAVIAFGALRDVLAKWGKEGE